MYSLGYIINICIYRPMGNFFLFFLQMGYKITRIANMISLFRNFEIDTCKFRLLLFAILLPKDVAPREKKIERKKSGNPLKA